MALGSRLNGITHIAGRTQDTNRDGSVVGEFVDNMVSTESGRYDLLATGAGFIMPGGNVVQTGVSLLFNGMAREAEINEAIQHACRNPEVAYAISCETGCDPRSVDTQSFARLGTFNRAVRGDMDEAEEHIATENIKFGAATVATFATPWTLGLSGLTGMAVGGAAGIGTTMGIDAMQQTRKNMTVLGAVNMIYAHQCDEQGRYVRNRNNDVYITQTFMVMTRGCKETREALASRLGWKEGGDETAEQRIANALETHLRARAAGNREPTQLSQVLDNDLTKPAKQSVNGMLATDIGKVPEMDGQGRVRFIGQRYHERMLDQGNPLTFAQLGLCDLNRLRHEELRAELDGPTPQPPVQQPAAGQQSPAAAQPPAPQRAARPIDPLIQEVARTFHNYGVSTPTATDYPSPLSRAAGRSSDEPTPAV